MKIKPQNPTDTAHYKTSKPNPQRPLLSITCISTRTIPRYNDKISVSFSCATLSLIQYIPISQLCLCDNLAFSCANLELSYTNLGNSCNPHLDMNFVKNRI